MLLRNYANRILWFSHSVFRPVFSSMLILREYAEDFVEDFCEAEDVSDVEWTEVVVEMVVNESIVHGEKGCSCSWFGRLCKEAQIEAVCP